jgi:hypothetical protein
MTHMETDLVAGVAVVVEFPVSVDEIAVARSEYAALDASTTAGYEEVRKAIFHLRTSRTKIEKRRKELKEPGLDFHRRVDAMAALLTEKIEEVESPLRRKKENADAAAALARRAEEDRVRAEVEAAAKAAREAEEERIAAEKAKLDEERAVFEARQRAVDAERVAREKAEKEERDRVAASVREAQAKIQAEREAIEERERQILAKEQEAAREAADRAAKARAGEEAKAAAEFARVEAERAAAAEVERLARVAAMRPDVDKVVAFAEAIRSLAADAAPDVESDEAKRAVLWALAKTEWIAATLVKFQPTGDA